MDTSIQSITAREVLDSRGNPTIRCEVKLADGAKGTFTTPSGASVGIFEAVELRDGDLARYNGLGVQKAVANIKDKIANELIGNDALNQAEIDKKLIKLDGTKNKSKLGANAILAVSIASCKAAAASQSRTLYNYLDTLISDYIGKQSNDEMTLPIPMFNILNGGAHADNTLSIQEFIVMPVGIETYPEKLRAGVEINHKLETILKERGATTAVGDEGGFAPNLPTDETALDFLVEAIEATGYKLGNEIVLGLDIAASQYWEEDDKVYAIPNVSNERVLVDKPQKIIDYYLDLFKQYPIHSIEDPLADDDWDGWKHFAKKFDFKENLLIGDDLTVTNPERVNRAIKEKVINGVIIKPNQVGTLTEVFDVLKLCDQHKVTKIISHRSGESTDTFIADLAVAARAEFIKDGAPVRGERTAKYNRLLDIYEELNPEAQTDNEEAKA